MLNSHRLSLLYAFILRIYFKISGQNIHIAKGVRIHPSASIDPDKGSIYLGPDTALLRGVILKAYHGKISIGHNVTINPYSVLYGHGGLTIGNKVRIAAHAVIIPADHAFENRDKTIAESGETKIGITVGNDVWIGAGAKILDGAIVPDGCVIGANAVVKGQLDAYGVYGGVPAKLLKMRL